MKGKEWESGGGKRGKREREKEGRGGSEEKGRRRGPWCPASALRSDSVHDALRCFDYCTFYSNSTIDILTPPLSSF